MEIICLANSYKRQGRCIAGIDSVSGRWIRPISHLDDGRIPLGNQSIPVEQISILDRVYIPVDPAKKLGKENYEVENIRYKNEIWRITGKAHIPELLRHCESSLIHPNGGRAIPFEELQSIAPVRTLQLIEVMSLSCHKSDRDQWSDRNKWRAVIGDLRYGLVNYDLSITDPVATERLNQGEPLSPHCLLCLSLSKPWYSETVHKHLCYRLIAGIIELLPELQLILTEMQRLSWTQEQGRQYLEQQFGKQSRYQLTEAEARQFLSDLKTMGHLNE